MHEQQRTLARLALEDRQVEAALFAHPATITWLTGFAPPVQLGPHPYAGGPPLLWYDGERFTLVVVDGHAELASAFAEEADGAVITYTGYTYQQPIDGPRRMLEALSHLWAVNSRARVGVEIQSLTASVLATLWRSGATPNFAAIDGLLTPLRMVKTAEEIAKMRAAFRLSDVGHAAAREAVHPGAREIDVWAAVHAAIERAAGKRVPLGNDCVVGTRPWNVGGWPLDFAITEGDSLIVDLSPIPDGYWSDGCATYVAGTPSEHQKEIHAIVREALALGASMLRPGTISGEIDEAMREHIRRAGHPGYPHHGGHGIGATGHESPRIIPDSEEVLEAGMVIMLEPGIYLPGRTGVRLEDGFLITPEGAEILTNHSRELT